MSAMRGRILPLLILLVFPLSLGGGGEHRYLYAAVYRLENRGSQPIKLGEDDRSIPLFWSSRYQRVEVLNSTPGLVRRYLDDDDNPVALLDLPSEIPPGGNLTLSVYYSIRLRERPRPRIDPDEAGGLDDIPESLIEEFCVSTETFKIDDEIRRLAEEITENESTVLGMVLALIDWIRDHIYYGSGEVPKYPQETLRDGFGDCDDQAILLITLCRALGIPALLQLGCVYIKNYEVNRFSWEGHLELIQRNIGWHGWALVYIPPWGWLPVDLTLRTVGDPMKCITEAPEYGGYIAICYNISRSSYVGESREEREYTISSGLYFTIHEKLILERRSGVVKPQIIALAATSVLMFLILMLKGRKSLLTA